MVRITSLIVYNCDKIVVLVSLVFVTRGDNATTLAGIILSTYAEFFLYM